MSLKIAQLIENESERESEREKKRERELSVPIERVN